MGKELVYLLAVGVLVVVVLDLGSKTFPGLARGLGRLGAAWRRRREKGRSQRRRRRERRFRIK